jgi:hypothetical protein
VGKAIQETAAARRKGPWLVAVLPGQLEALRQASHADPEAFREQGEPREDLMKIGRFWLRETAVPKSLAKLDRDLDGMLAELRPIVSEAHRLSEEAFELCRRMDAITGRSR